MCSNHIGGTKKEDAVHWCTSSLENWRGHFGRVRFLHLPQMESKKQRLLTPLLRDVMLTHWVSITLLSAIHPCGFIENWHILAA